MNSTIYQTDIALRWGDMDAIGHVNNTVYFRFFEQARVEWMATVPEARLDPEVYVVIVHTECTFLSELKAPGAVTVRIKAGTIGRTSLTQHYELVRTDAPDALVATGSAKMVWVDSRTKKSTPIPLPYLDLVTVNT
ncbi:acyl-CoA thioesterase [Limnobacter litoralis]|uniref:Thioesterase n=1 Tax=Limnobacter litoralis TaxID=481366 RepID=A0ABQ5YLQ1_9BURK|nr:thioesterase family protein [Limnobacter litoralis]GLR25488.1 thioesterase [Limnobacter litoralis]